MKRAVLVSLALLIANAAPAEEMKSPHISVAQVDWDAAAASLAGEPAGQPAEAFAPFNAASQSRFLDIGKSPVPVLLPLDIDGFIDALRKDQRKEQAAGKSDILVDNFMRGGFHATAFFQAGPAGYDAAFSLRTAEVSELSDIRYADPVYVLFSGLAA